MRDVVILFLHLIVTVVRLSRPGGLRSVVAESLLLKHQLRIRHNAVYLLGWLPMFCWLKHEEDEEERTTARKQSRAGYNLAALLFFFLFLDNLLRRAEGQGWKGFWPCSGRLEVVVLFGMLSLAAQFVYWSRIVSGLNQEHA